MKKSKTTKGNDKYGVLASEKSDPIILPEVINDRSYVDYTLGNNFSFGDEREFKVNPVASKYAFDLFKEEDAVVAPIIRVKHIKSRDKMEKWKIFENNKNTFTLDGKNFSKREKEFFHSVEGIQFLLAYCKSNSLTVSGLKKEIKAKLTKLSRKV